MNQAIPKDHQFIERGFEAQYFQENSYTAQGFERGPVAYEVH